VGIVLSVEREIDINPQEFRSATASFAVLDEQPRVIPVPSDVPFPQQGDFLLQSKQKGSLRYEGDLLAGAKNTYIATLVERHSRFAMLIKVPSKNTEVVVAALSQQVRKLPATLRRSLTWDRGLEMAKHKDFTVATDVKVYFCDPQSPWQRGTNENTNLLLRQYFPRGTDLSVHSQVQLDQVALRLNQRPRKTLGFQTPASRLQASVASTV
jgi:IS30 family transposase